MYKPGWLFEIWFYFGRSVQVFLFLKTPKSPSQTFVLSTVYSSFLRGKDLHRGFLTWLWTCTFWIEYDLSWCFLRAKRDFKSTLQAKIFKSIQTWSNSESFETKVCQVEGGSCSYSTGQDSKSKYNIQLPWGEFEKATSSLRNGGITTVFIPVGQERAFMAQLPANFQLYCNLHQNKGHRASIWFSRCFTFRSRRFYTEQGRHSQNINPSLSKR